MEENNFNEKKISDLEKVGETNFRGKPFQGNIIGGGGFLKGEKMFVREILDFLEEKQYKKIFSKLKMQGLFLERKQFQRKNLK